MRGREEGRWRKVEGGWRREMGGGRREEGPEVCGRLAGILLSP